MKVEKCVIEEYFDAELVVSQETKNLLILECSLWATNKTMSYAKKIIFDKYTNQESERQKQKKTGIDVDSIIIVMKR